MKESIVVQQGLEMATIGERRIVEGRARWIWIVLPAVLFVISWIVLVVDPPSIRSSPKAADEFNPPGSYVVRDGDTYRIATVNEALAGNP